MKRLRIDRLLVELGLAESRTKAQALVMAGVVLVDDKRVEKPSETFQKDLDIRIKGNPDEIRYVGRGGLKLERALVQFHICPIAYVCLDIGSSTGGFTDCLLQRGASIVYAVDAGTNQLAWTLRRDSRVVVMENTNARYLGAGSFDVAFDLITMDVSFISATRIFGALTPLLKKDGRIIVLVKPQFEVGRGEVGKGGIVRDPQKHKAAVERVTLFAEGVGLRTLSVIESPLLGAAGNKEFLALFERK